jgi:hypothetical protein
MNNLCMQYLYLSANEFRRHLQVKEAKENTTLQPPNKALHVESLRHYATAQGSIILSTGSFRIWQIPFITSCCYSAAR